MRTYVLAASFLLGLPLLHPVDQAREKGQLDAVIAAPASHMVILENDRVRVLRVTIAPGVTEPAHTHAWASVMEVEASQPLTYITFSDHGGRLVETKRQLLPAHEGSAPEWMEPEGPHAVRNRGTSEYRAIRIEIEPAAQIGANADQ